MKQHPDNAAQFHFLQTNNPPASYANCAFYGIHLIGPRCLICVCSSFTPETVVITVADHKIVGRVPQASPFCPNIAATPDSAWSVKWHRRTSGSAEPGHLSAADRLADRVAII
jgi:hypothetical protein